MTVKAVFLQDFWSFSHLRIIAPSCEYSGRGQDRTSFFREKLVGGAQGLPNSRYDGPLLSLLEGQAELWSCNAGVERFHIHAIDSLSFPKIHYNYLFSSIFPGLVVAQELTETAGHIAHGHNLQVQKAGVDQHGAYGNISSSIP